MDYTKFFKKNEQQPQPGVFKNRQSWPRSGPSGVRWLEKPKNAR